jgi:hypothetical protein
VTAQDIEDLAVGAAIFGTGGGGDPYVGKMMALGAIRKHGDVTLLDPDEVADDAFIVPTAMMGAPTIMLERVPSGDETVKALRLLEEHVGRRAAATMAIECGGINSTIPFSVAARAGLPVVDADGMGRAFPELQMETFSVYGLPGSPIALVDERGDQAVIRTVDNLMLEWLARGVTVRMGGAAHIAEYSMTGAEMKRTAIKRTLSLGMRLGATLRRAHEEKMNPLEALQAATEGSDYGKAIPLFVGKIIDLERRTTAGFAVGSVEIEGYDHHAGERLHIRFQNENLVAQVGGRSLATVPDLITVLDAETGYPLTTEGLRYGYRVLVIGIPAPEIMRTPDALAVWGPGYFGYKDLAYTPLELLHPHFYTAARLSDEKRRRYGAQLAKV